MKKWLREAWADAIDSGRIRSHDDDGEETSQFFKLDGFHLARTDQWGEQHYCPMGVLFELEETPEGDWFEVRTESEGVIWVAEYLGDLGTEYLPDVFRKEVGLSQKDVATIAALSDAEASHNIIADYIRNWVA